MDEDQTFMAADRTTLILNSNPKLLNNTNFSTPQQNNFNNEVNSQTVTKKPRARQQTVTVDNQLSKEVDDVFNQVLNMSGIDDHIEELKRQMQRLFIQKEREWEYKLNEAKKSEGEELALCRIKLKSAQTVLAKVDEFSKKLNADAPNLLRQSSSNNLYNGQGGGEASINGLLTSNQLSSNGRAFSTDLLNDLVKERETLREEYAQLENSYSDLFKRYEKMRENCVLLKNSEEELKNMVEEDAAKYDRLLSRYQELRESAAEKLNMANLEIQRIIKQHDENTLGLRCRNKMNENQIQTLNLTIQGKDVQIEELNRMCEDLMQKNGIMADDDDEEDDDDCVEQNGFA